MPVHIDMVGMKSPSGTPVTSSCYASPSSPRPGVSLIGMPYNGNDTRMHNLFQYDFQLHAYFWLEADYCVVFLIMNFQNIQWHGTREGGANANVNQ